MDKKFDLLKFMWCIKTMHPTMGLKQNVQNVFNINNHSTLQPLNLSTFKPLNPSTIKLPAFTMAEILLSLTIIGVVAAITLPSLTGNINERTWKTQKKALYARMSQAIALMPNLNGYGIGETDTQTANNATKAFITNGLAKVYKINNICDNNSLKKCGFPDKIKTLRTSGSYSTIVTPTKLTSLNPLFNVNTADIKYSQIDTKSVAFETQNGESILAFYNPTCSYALASPADSSYKSLLQPTMCANLIYDVNGRKGPNEIGKDMGFITVFYPTDSIVTSLDPIAGWFYLDQTASRPEFSISAANAGCRKYGSRYGADNSRMANFYELATFFINEQLISDNNSSFVSSTFADDTNLYIVKMQSGTVDKVPSTRFISSDLRYFMCVKQY